MAAVSLTSPCRDVPEGISFPRGLRSGMLRTGQAGGGHGTPCAGSWHLLCSLVLPDMVNPSANSFWPAQCEGSALMNFWECHIWQIPTGPFCQWRTAGHRPVDVVFPAGHPWPSFNSLGPPRWDKGARMKSSGQILVVCTLGRETVMESCNYLY